MKYLASTHIYVIWVAQSYSFYERKRSIVHGGERDTLSEATVTLRTVVTFVTWNRVSWHLRFDAPECRSASRD